MKNFSEKCLTGKHQKVFRPLWKQKTILKEKSKATLNFTEQLEGYRDASISALASLTTLIAATTIGKRVITPFIATPLADKTKEWMCRNDKPAQIHKDTKNTYDTKTPACEQGQQTKIGNLLDIKVHDNAVIKNS